MVCPQFLLMRKEMIMMAAMMKMIGSKSSDARHNEEGMMMTQS